MYQIIASSQYGRETIDTANTKQEAERLVSEYRLAFGSGFCIYYK